MKTQNKESQEQLSPSGALELLKEGNNRFISNKEVERDLLNQVNETSAGQYPFAAILSCIDSRVPVETIFDQGIGDVFSARVAGNIVNVDMLGSIEYACKVAGSKVVVVLGHSKCGAVTAACKGVELGNITALLNKIQPAVSEIKKVSSEFDAATIETVAVKNVQLSIEQIKNESPILSELESEGNIIIVGAIYNVDNGIVTWL